MGGGIKMRQILPIDLKKLALSHLAEGLFTGAIQKSN